MSGVEWRGFEAEAGRGDGGWSGGCVTRRVGAHGWGGVRIDVDHVYHIFP